MFSLCRNKLSRAFFMRGSFVRHAFFILRCIMERDRDEFLDGTLILSILEKQNTDVYNIQERILNLSNGALCFDSQYWGIIMMRLRTAKLIEKDRTKPHGIDNRITEKGKAELENRLRLFYDYEHIINTIRTSKPVTEEKDRFDSIYKSFTAGIDYIEAEKTMTDLIRAAFRTGWVAGGGTPPENSSVANLIKNNKHTSN